jgi:hypothetical protein
MTMNETTKIIVGHPGPGQTGPTGPGPDELDDLDGLAWGNANWNLTHVNFIDQGDKWALELYFAGEDKPDVFRFNASGLDEEAREELRGQLRHLLAMLPGGPYELPTPTAG